MQSAGKNFFKDLKDYKFYDKKFSWEILHVKTLKILRSFANKNPETEVIIKTKTGEKNDLNDYKNLPKNIKVIHEGAGHSLLRDSKVVIGWNSTIILEAIAANRFILIPIFIRKIVF